MRVVVDRPPLFDEIVAAFPIAAKPGVIFAWRDKIFNPSGRSIAPELMVHEAVHGERQMGEVQLDGKWPGATPGIEGWWRRYIADPAFRLAEEIPAHLAEFQALCAQQRACWHSERNMRRALATHVARKLSGPLYGHLISASDAKALLVSEPMS